MNAQPDWEDLKLFLAVARSGSLSAASHGLGLHHTTVARRLDQLEAVLQTRLVDRLARGTRLTPAGEALLGPVRRVEEEVLAATRAVAGHDQQLSGTVRLTTTPDLLTTLLPILAQFRERYPGVSVAVDAADAMRSLGRREADVALRASVRAPDEAVAWRIAATAWATYVHVDADPDHAVLLGDTLRTLPAHRHQSARSAPDSALVVDSVEAAARAIEAGFGAGLLPCFIGDRLAQVRRIGPILSGDTGAVWVLVHVDLRRVARVRALVDLLREQLASRVAMFEGAPPLDRTGP